jgi:hypothetical protein
LIYLLAIGLERGQCSGYCWRVEHLRCAGAHLYTEKGLDLDYYKASLQIEQAGRRWL